MSDVFAKYGGRAEEDTQEQEDVFAKYGGKREDPGDTSPNPVGSASGRRAVMPTNINSEAAAKDNVPAWESFVRGTSDMASFGFMDNIAAGIGSALTGANYEHMLEAERRRSKQASEEDPYTYGSGQVVGTIATSALPTASLAKLGQAGTKAVQGLTKFMSPGLQKATVKGAEGLGKIGAASGRAGVDAGLQAMGDANAETWEETLAAGKEGFKTGAQWGAGLTGVPMAMSGTYKGMKKFVPGTEGAFDSVNTLSSKVGATMPWQKAGPSDLKRLLDNPKLRNQIKDLDVPAEIGNVRRGLEESLPKMDDAVSAKFRNLEDLSTSVTDPEDIAKFEALQQYLGEQKSKIKQFPGFYSNKAKKLLKTADESLTKGGPKEVGLLSQGKPVQMLGEEGSVAAKKRALELRRDLDDQIKNRDFSVLPRHDKELLRETRDKLQETLKKEFSGSDQRAKADQLYSEYRRAKDGLVDPISKRGRQGTREIAEDKLDSLARSKTGRGRVFDKQIQNMEEFMVKAQPDIGEIPEVRKALSDIKDLRELIDMQGLQQSLDLAGGGPTSRAVNNAMQIFAASSTGGLSLLALPVTDPVAWTKLVDGLGSAGETFGRSILNATRKLATENPGMFARLTQMSEEEK